MTSQISLFGGEEPLKINKKIRLIELFAGIGAQAKALENIGADFEHYRICEFDKYAVTAYNAIHGTDFPVSDITKWTASDMGIEEKDKYEYIVTYSFPCQSLSIAGKQAGMAKDSGTRSGLLWEVERILEECVGNLPQVLLMENVDAILFKKNRKHFFQWCNRLEEFGYKNYYEVLNAKDYGIPQNRNRCFMVSILGDYYFEFPKPIKLELRVKDLLEKEVPEKYYISKKTIECFINNTINQRAKGNTFTFKPITENGVAGSILTKAGSRPCDNYLTDNNTVTRLFGIFDQEGQKHQAGSVYDKNGLCPPLDTMQGGYRQPMIVTDGIKIKTNNSKGYDIAQDGDTINLEQPNSKTRRGRVGKQIAQTIMTSTEQAVVEKENIPCELRKDEGIRTFNDGCMGALRTISECGDKHIIECQREDLVCYNRFKEDGVQTSLNDRVYDSRCSGLAITTNPLFMPNYLAREKPEFGRMGKQAVETLNKNQCDCGDTINPYNKTVDKTGISPTITTRPEGLKTAILPVVTGEYKYRIRKLMPIECYKLQGFTREDFFKVKEAGISDSQCYKQAGNSITVPVLEAIFRNMNIKGVKRWQE